MLDVREPWEYDICHIEGAELVATVRLRERVESLDPDQPVVCICHHGVRSMHVARFLTEHGFSQAHNLSGGIDAWARQVDRSMPTY
jgi:rhodanese-related sulfurtransferase